MPRNISFAMTKVTRIEFEYLEEAKQYGDN